LTFEAEPEVQLKMGYNGMLVRCDEAAMKGEAPVAYGAGVLIQGWLEMETLMVRAGRSTLAHFPGGMHISQHMHPLLGRRLWGPKATAQIERPRRAPVSTPFPPHPTTGVPISTITVAPVRNDPCTVPPTPNLFGPDTPPGYDPTSDDDGCFIEEQGENNCYAYGSDIITNTFPQPGRGSGQKWSANTCDDMGAAAVRDGLVYVGTTLPVGQPPAGHYVALLIWPETNFHWIRHDNTTFWSHKPGGTEVRNVDNNGQPITDPSKSDFSPWTQFCAYYVAQPSKLTIN